MKREIIFSNRITGSLSNPCPKDPSIMVGSCACRECMHNNGQEEGFIKCGYDGPVVKTGPVRQWPEWMEELKTGLLENGFAVHEKDDERLERGRVAVEFLPSRWTINLIMPHYDEYLEEITARAVEGKIRLHARRLSALAENFAGDSMPPPTEYALKCKAERELELSFIDRLLASFETAILSEQEDDYSKHKPDTGYALSGAESKACFNSSVDFALLHALKRCRDRLPAVDGYFHKAFRQADVCEDGDMDMVIWNLLDLSSLFWKAFEPVSRERAEAMGKKEEDGE